MEKGCPKCGNEEIAKARQPGQISVNYCAICDYEWQVNITKGE